jgi:Uma2 family endonuclease
MADPAKRGATYADLMAVPDHLVAELIHGALEVSPRPGAGHALAASVLGGELSGPFHRGRGGPGGWVILDEPELHLGPNVLVPDLGGWRRERMPVVPDVAAFELAPDWVCEVLSPRTAATDRADKLPIYASFGVAFIWYVDPLARTLEVFRTGDGHATLIQTFRDAAVIRAEPFEAIAVELGALWER